MHRKIDLFEVPMGALNALRKELEIRQYPDGHIEVHMPNKAKDVTVHLLSWDSKQGWSVG